MSTIDFYAKANDKGLFSDVATKDLYDSLKELDDKTNEYTCAAGDALRKAWGSFKTKASQHEEAVETIVEVLKTKMEEFVELETDNELIRDVVFRAFSTVNWEEIAERFVENAEEK